MGLCWLKHTFKTILQLISMMVFVTNSSVGVHDDFMTNSSVAIHDGFHGPYCEGILRTVVL